LNLTPQAVYHHIKKLLKGELIEVTREERIGHIIESYYRATAELYSLREGKASAQSLRDKKLAKEQMKTVFNVLEKLDFHLDFDEDKFNQLINLQAQLEECCTGIEKLEDAICSMDDLDWITRAQVESFVQTLSMSDEEFNRQHEIQRKFRSLLKSLVKK
jgi:DNA-binding transcriptional ArsR family regulator